MKKRGKQQPRPSHLTRKVAGVAPCGEGIRLAAKKKDFVFSIAAYRPPECSNQMGVARGLMLVKRGGKG
jgi:hypothetical protein